MIANKDITLLGVSLFVSSASAAPFVAVAATQPESLLQLPWLVILGSVGLTMLGGLVATLLALHVAEKKGAKINVPLQVAMDLGVSVILGLAAWAVVAVNGLRAEYLVGLLPLVGVAGQQILPPVILSLVEGIRRFADKFTGKANRTE